MIWELIKRDPSWRAMPLIALVVAVPALFMPGRSVGVYFLTTVPFIISIGVPGFRQRYSLFHAVLPIPAKELFLARLGSLMACIWLPILMAVALTPLLRREFGWRDGLPLLEAGAMITVAATLVQCIRVRTIQPPAWLVVLAYTALAPVFILREFSSPQSGRSEAVVLCVCALLSAALLGGAWAVLPKSFQLAGSELRPTEQMDQIKRNRLRGKGWLLVRSIYGWQAALSVVAVFSLLFVGSAAFAMFMIIPGFFFKSRLHLRWLWPLPVSMRQVFWAMWLPLTLGMALGAALRLVFTTPVGWKAGIVTFAVILLCWMLQICAVELYGWKNLRQKSSTARLLLAGAPSLIAFLIFVTPLALHAFDPASRNLDPVLDLLVSRLVGILPDNSLLIGAIAALPIAGLYFLAEKLFREMEFSATTS